MNNSPINYNDPTGHKFIDPECGFQGQDCSPADDPLPPYERLKRHFNSSSCDIPISPECNQESIDLVNDIEAYMRQNPDYNFLTDPNLTGYGEGGERNWRAFFQGARIGYWESRANGDLEEAWRLFYYYDLHYEEYSGDYYWDSSRVDWESVGLDVTSAVLSFVALNEVSNSLKIPKTAQSYARNGAAISGGISGINAAVQGDPTGVVLSAGGFAPGPIGGIVSAGSAMRGLSKGFYYVQWQPSIPRY